MNSVRSWRSSYQFVLGACIALVVLADWLFYDATIGWTAAIYAGALLLAMTLHKARFLHTRGGKVVFAAVVAMLAAFALDPSILAILLALVLLSLIAIVNSDGWCGELVEWTIQWTKFLLGGWGRIILDNRIAAAWIRRSRGTRVSRGTAKRWAVPLILGSGFLMLFAWANPIIADWLSHALDHLLTWLEQIPQILEIARIAMWVGFAVVVWMLLRVRLGRSRQSVTGAQWMVAELTESMAPAADWVVRCLIVFNAVFAIETALDIYYLWGGATLPPGMSYVSYAHRGAYPLIAAALLAGAFVVITFPSGGQTSRMRGARWLVYAWLVQTIFLTVSAAWRLKLYITVSEMTRLRLAAAIWMGLVGMGLAWIVWRLARNKTNHWLFAANILTTAAVLYACCFADLDGFIAEYNVRHCAEMGGGGIPLDIWYLEHLGPAALPALSRFANAKSVQGSTRAYAMKTEQVVKEQLREQLKDWRGWSVRRQTWARLLVSGDGSVVADERDGHPRADHF